MMLSHSVSLSPSPPSVGRECVVVAADVSSSVHHSDTNWLRGRREFYYLRTTIAIILSNFATNTRRVRSRTNNDAEYSSTRSLSKKANTTRTI